MNLLPSVLIGGPPHSGKSVLAYSLSRALRARDVPHYVLRAYPDGEGDWANQASQKLVRAIRIKGVGDPQWVQRICRDIGQRHLPLVVDPGGKPTDWQEAIFGQCTHTILLTPDQESHHIWQALVRRHGLTLMADLRSDLHGANVIESADAVLRGQISGLERGHTAAGPTFEALVERLCGLFAYTHDELRQQHLRRAPVELTLELKRLGRTLNALNEADEWIPRHLPAALDYLPPGTALGLYDRAPNWLYAALALFAYPEPLYQFDTRLGWVAPPALVFGQPDHDALLQARLYPRSDHARVEFWLRDAYLDYAEADGLYIPPMPADSGVVLSGKLPLWLWTALALAYRSAPWLGIYQPQLHDQAVIVYSHLDPGALGQLTPSAAPG